MSHQRLFPSFPVPHVGHFCPTGRPPIPPPSSWTHGFKGRSWRDGIQEGVGKFITFIQLWSYVVGGAYTMRHPALEDIDGDGVVEVVTWSTDTLLYVISGVDGILKASWDTVGAQGNGVTVCDVDGDGLLEIFIGAKKDAQYAFKPDGTLVWSATGDFRWQGTSTLRDIDGDGIIECINQDYINKTVPCWNAVNGALKWSFTRVGYGWGPVCVEDINGDGLLETYCFDGNENIYCLSSGGVEIWRYSGRGSGYPLHDGGSGDIDGDGFNEVVGAGAVGDPRRYIVVDENGVLLWLYERTGYNIGVGPIGDFDKDGTVELIMNDGGGILRCFLPDGTEKWSFTSPEGAIGSSLAFDIDNDGLMEICCCSGAYWFILKTDGTLYAQVSTLAKPECHGAMNIYGDAKCELVAGLTGINEIHAWVSD